MTVSSSCIPDHIDHAFFGAALASAVWRVPADADFTVEAAAFAVFAFTLVTAGFDTGLAALAPFATVSAFTVSTGLGVRADFDIGAVTLATDVLAAGFALGVASGLTASTLAAGATVLVETGFFGVSFASGALTCANFGFGVDFFAAVCLAATFDAGASSVTDADLAGVPALVAGFAAAFFAVGFAGFVCTLIGRIGMPPTAAVHASATPKLIFRNSVWYSAVLLHTAAEARQ